MNPKEFTKISLVSILVGLGISFLPNVGFAKNSITTLFPLEETLNEGLEDRDSATDRDRDREYLPTYSSNSYLENKFYTNYHSVLNPEKSTSRLIINAFSMSNYSDYPNLSHKMMVNLWEKSIKSKKADKTGVIWLINDNGQELKESTISEDQRTSLENNQANNGLDFYPQLKTDIKDETVEIILYDLNVNSKLLNSSLDQENGSWSAYLSDLSTSQKESLPKLISIEEGGIKLIRFSLDKEISKYILTVTPLDGMSLTKPIVKYNEKNKKISVLFNRPIKGKVTNTSKSISPSYINNDNRLETLEASRNRAKAPPLGDIAVGSILINSRGYVEVNGPDISLNLKEADTKDVLMTLAKMGGYGFIYIPSRAEIKSEEDKLERKVTLVFKEENYDRAINSILLASGLQGKTEGNLLLVGESVLGKSFGPQISKVYRLNQTSANSAADYLASLGAMMSKVDVKSTVSDGMPVQDSISQSSTNDDTNIISYGASQGPLKGLLGTTDTRLHTITLIGDQTLIEIAEKYLHQLDLRQRQVALSVKILDVALNDASDMSNSMAFKVKNTFILNDAGFADIISGNNSIDSLTVAQDSTKLVTNTVASRAVTDFGDKDFLNWFKAKIVSKSAKVLATPTLIMGENQEELVGGMEIAGAENGMSNSSIGRPFANESFITVGTKVITNYNVEQAESGPPACSAEFGTAGLTFGAKVHKIDDNGFVTFSISPELSAVTEKVSLNTCGEVSVLSVRRLDTGTVRVRDGQTLVLTGVIKDDDIKTINKWPIIGDLPIIGSIFRATSNSRLKSELIIMVTPTVIKDDQPYYINDGSNLIQKNLP